MAFHLLTHVDVRLSGGVIKLKELFQLSDRHSRHGRPAKAQRRPTAGQSPLRDMECTMLARMQTRLSSRILTQSPKKFFRLASQMRRENVNVLGDKPVRNDWRNSSCRVPGKVIWWARKKHGVEELIVKLEQGMYENVCSRVRVGEGFSKESEVKVGVHQGSVLSPLLFITEALSHEFRAGVPVCR